MAVKGTEVDIAVVTDVTQEEADAFRLDPHLVSLMWDEPFFSKVLRPVTKIRTDQISTAGVLAKDGEIFMWWNPRFLVEQERDGKKKVKGLMKHEGYHLVFEHTTTRRHTPHIIWNFATDLAINSLIPEDELPTGGLIPGKSLPPLKAEQLEKMKQESIERYNRISDKISSFPKGLASEEYFSKLMEDEELRKDIEEGEQGGFPGGFDDHEGWDELSDEEREFVKGKIRQAIAEATEECDRTGQWGSVPAEVRKKIREMISNEVNWKKVLRSAIGSKRRANRTSSIRRLNRKYPAIHPGVKQSYTSSWAVYVDQSGSVGDEELALAFGELGSLAKKTSFDVYYFDTSVDQENMFTWKKGQSAFPKRTRCGGTCFDAPTAHANANKSKYDGFIIITDGEASAPKPAKLRRVWVLVPGTKLLFDRPRLDILVKMKRNKKVA